MKILMFGRGVIAAAYGWALEQAGHEIEFYVRPGRAAKYGSAIDLDLLDARRRVWGRRVTAKWPVRYRESLEPDHDFDLIVVSVQHYSFPEAVSFLAPRVGRATVLAFNNLWVEPEAAVAEERAAKAQDATEDNTDRAEKAADKAEDSAAASDKSADKAEKSAADAKK